MTAASSTGKVMLYIANVDSWYDRIELTEIDISPFLLIIHIIDRLGKALADPCHDLR